uniref:Arf-GAP domain-containing protein n=1 Tax=Mola mola TaxID=94237 RepID=A0A3Q4ABP1_MOLML
MTGKSVKDVDRYQAVLNSLLALEENKYCADCESKGPRWASWNLGIFICIRCAGIHRNLGVHISKVKSVNLDQWTQEQVQCVQEMGNAKAKRLYEAFLPECFQRPESDQSAETFIRDKYDKKKYMDKVIDIQMLRVRRRQWNIKTGTSIYPVLDAPAPSPAVSNRAGCVPDSNEGPAGSSPALAHSALDLFNSLPAPSSASSSKTTVTHCPLYAASTASVPENLSLFLDPAPKAEEGTVKKLSKDSILSLYASTPSVHASLYMNQMGYMTHPYGSYHSLAQAGGMGGTMMASQMAMMGQQPSGMIGLHQNGAMGQQNGLMGAQGVMAQPGSVMASPYMTGMAQGMMGQQQVGALPHQQVYGVQNAQQLRWNITQVTQHMAGMNVYNSNGMMGYSGQHTGGSTAPNSGHMTAQTWK